MTRNPARVTVSQGEGNQLIAICSRPGHETMSHLTNALHAIPGITNITPLEEPGQMAFTMIDAPPLDELAEELTAWVA